MLPMFASVVDGRVSSVPYYAPYVTGKVCVCVCDCVLAAIFVVTHVAGKLCAQQFLV